MRRIIIVFLFITFAPCLRAQQVNGVLMSDSGNLTVVKIWGTHYERGFAYGYLCGNKILDMFQNYYQPNFGSYMSLAHSVIASGTFYRIDSAYFEEARGVIDGIDSAGLGPKDIDDIDLIAGNCLLELLNLMKAGDASGMGCSSLMSWGSSTLGTDLNGHSVITRHLDWDNDPALVRNQMMVIHLPSEADEQPWITIGFAGLLSALSGVNQYCGTFQHMMSDFSGSPAAGTLYEPIWFSLRKALEKKDANNDGFHDTKDIHDVLTANSEGYGDGFIICTLGSSSSGSCDKIAEVAEVTPVMPYHVFRSNDFQDSIPADNLYAANYEIKRNDHYHFCTRYNNVRSALGNGLGISSSENWKIMRDTSVSLQPSSNIQMMQYIPEDGMLRLSVQKNGNPAYKNSPDTWLISDLFSYPAALQRSSADFLLRISPNPACERIHLRFYCGEAGNCIVRLYNANGENVMNESREISAPGMQHLILSISNLPSGLYLLQLESHSASASERFLLIR